MQALSLWYVITLAPLIPITIVAYSAIFEKIVPLRSFIVLIMVFIALISLVTLKIIEKKMRKTYRLKGRYSFYDGKMVCSWCGKNADNGHCARCHLSLNCEEHIL